MDQSGKIKVVFRESVTPEAATGATFRVEKTIFVFYYSIYTFTASKKVNLI
jgi:hypothetical protein